MFADLARRLGESSVEVFAGERPGERGGGSGVIVSEDGWIATNAHVVRSRAPVVRLADGRQFRGQLVNADKQRDLAIVRIEVGSLVPVTLGDSSSIHPGEVVVAIGNPFGVACALSAGVIHSAADQWWIHADINLAPGNSGGLLANARGQVIGINAMIWAGLALAVPSNAVRAFLARSARQRAAA